MPRSRAPGCCCAGFGLKGVRCVRVEATIDNKSKKPAYNAEVFGRVRDAKSGESALYGDFAEASDGGKIADIDEVPPGKSSVNFTLKLEQGSEGAELEFVNLKARMYPGMRQVRPAWPRVATVGWRHSRSCCSRALGRWLSLQASPRTTLPSCRTSAS